ncbi:ribonuclease H2, subunit B [Crepidotus variabilis]|uniref:Ribonuclease H2 subunit B n=1 Tax=Crepidotus variabilis TaxID=179855 RepID=A0A9P6EHG7_9AGAR|nr:ribonuclease H2, subunit B [Crepidotus variabilis]
MSTHFAILPTDHLQLLSSSVNPSSNLDFLRLPHPRTGLPALFLPTQCLPSYSASANTTSILEVQSISPPDERSWILDDNVFADGKMLTMTPVDPAFLLLPILKLAETKVTEANPQFRTSDDIFEATINKLESANSRNEKSDNTLRDDLLRFCSLECTKKALSRLCDSKELSPDIVVYRHSTDRVIKYLRSKVLHLEKAPAFLASKMLTRNLAREGLMEDGQEDMLKLGRTRACCDLLAQYLSSEMRELLLNSYDFSALQKYVELQREEAMRQAAENAPVPRTKSQGTKDKLEEKEASTTAKKRKSNKASHGVETLKKVNTKSMPKLSTFFEKKT